MAQAIAANKKKDRKPRKRAAPAVDPRDLREQAKALTAQASELERAARTDRPARRQASPRFAEWITKLTPDVVARELGVSRWTVYGWRRGALGKDKGYWPDPSRLQEIIRLAAGALTVADIYPSGER